MTLTLNASRGMRVNGQLQRLEAVIGLPVWGTPRLPIEARPRPVAHCVAPARANYVGKFATGIADNQALKQVGAALGTLGAPAVVFPRIRAAHARPPACEGHIETLREAGAELVYGAGVWALNEPRQDLTDR
ncbi:flavoprotein [Streptomyces sp. NPDC002426]